MSSMFGLRFFSPADRQAPRDKPKAPHPIALRKFLRVLRSIVYFAVKWFTTLVLNHFLRICVIVLKIIFFGRFCFEIKLWPKKSKVFSIVEDASFFNLIILIPPCPSTQPYFPDFNFHFMCKRFQFSWNTDRIVILGLTVQCYWKNHPNKNICHLYKKSSIEIHDCEFLVSKYNQLYI